MKMYIFILLIGLIISGFSLSAQNIDLTVSNVRSSTGQIIVQIFRTHNDYENRKPYMTRKVNKGSMVKGKINFNFTLEPGVYGFALLDDENLDQKMNYNFIGMPKEGFGFSNYEHTGFSSPVFNSFKFSIAKDQKLKVFMKIRYL